MNEDRADIRVKRWGTGETIFVIWVEIALAALIPITMYLQGWPDRRLGSVDVGNI